MCPPYHHLPPPRVSGRASWYQAMGPVQGSALAPLHALGDHRLSGNTPTGAIQSNEEGTQPGNMAGLSVSPSSAHPLVG